MTPYKFLFDRTLPYRKVAFLDRDGVINVDHAYVYQRSEFDFVAQALEGARTLYQKGYALVIVTNQSGIGRSKYSEADFAKLSFWLAGRFKEAQAPLSAIYFCPHHPEKAFAPYLMECQCRKPQPGMLLSASKDFDIAMSESVLIGDKSSDMTAGKEAGLARRILVHTDGTRPLGNTTDSTDIAQNLYEASQLL